MRRTLQVLSLLTLIGVGAIVSLAHYVDTRSRIRVVSGHGALMATDSEGLQRMNQLFASSKTCTEAQTQGTSAPNLLVCAAPDPLIKSENSSPGLVYVPAGTKATSTGTSFLVVGGRLVDPYATNEYTMERDGVIEVEHVRIGLNESSDGWVEAALLRRACCAMP